MSTQQSPPFHRRRLGKVLRELRESARLSPGEVCRALEFSPARLSRMENGQTAPEVIVVKGMLDLYGIPVNDWEPYLEMTREARKKGWWQAYGVPAHAYVSLETAANSVKEFALAFIPGLLQTESYARAAFQISLLRRVAAEPGPQALVRIQRQQRLTDPDDELEFEAIIDEGALRRPVGGDAVMREQLSKVVALGALPNVTVRVLPTSAGAHLGMNSAFILLGFPSEEEPDMGYVDHVGGSVRMEKEDQVRTCKLTFDRLRTKALSPPDSVALVGRLIAGM
ncbi:helix-turn-helix domain-containing protein [Amycolatopsis nigrescens]|uniref:helix-turn-helix domain-containing protein n=1 Tax=Amycolatopsis nigrescens TaxID=381445 RepID=UPI00036392B7|nr:helix-turn-helix transcriptional regulator [Amycolatopsis nigrescens]